jgi:hypothetical protein
MVVVVVINGLFVLTPMRSQPPIYWEIIADDLSKAGQKPGGVWATFQRLIPTGERSGLLMHRNR